MEQKIKPHLPKFKPIEKGHRFVTDEGTLMICLRHETLGNERFKGKNKTNNVSVRTIIEETDWEITEKLKDTKEYDNFGNLIKEVSADVQAEKSKIVTTLKLRILISDFTEGVMKTKTHLTVKSRAIINDIVETLKEDETGLVGRVLMKTSMDPLQLVIGGGEPQNNEKLTEKEAIIASAYKALKKAKLLNMKEREVQQNEQDR